MADAGPREDRSSNADEASSPAAIVPRVAPKRPLSSNDPTRNISRRAWFVRLVLLALLLVALAVLLAGTGAILLK